VVTGARLGELSFEETEVISPSGPMKVTKPWNAVDSKRLSTKSVYVHALLHNWLWLPPARPSTSLPTLPRNLPADLNSEVIDKDRDSGMAELSRKLHNTRERLQASKQHTRRDIKKLVHVKKSLDALVSRGVFDIAAQEGYVSVS